ncbi:muscle, skeletal receptor tyrosine protein kinase isoform X2 [Cephus cinctus]|uniref:Muscle, skeletal receptor tyrosine protein kinase isoform X2 n=1 Tax=Cephus cinctus TaxID=211228 RepID=A0AAJ7W1S1_CEPCN|nr:muscle, skeletal receptor tyrosine protein kinase isoform X2 [Cephus cinctus]
MARTRIARRKAISSAEFRSEWTITEEEKRMSEIATRLQSTVTETEIRGCSDRPNICGKEAACRSFENNTSKCVCPHDLSSPTSDLKCPNRLTVSLTPRIINIIVPSSANFTNTTTALPKTEQVQQSYQTVPEIAIVLTILVTLLLAISGITYRYRRRCLNTKCRRSSLNPSPMNLKKGVLLANKYTPNPQYFTCISPEVPILRRDCLMFLHDIGEGCFGKVYKGELRCGDSIETVAVKVLKDSASREAEDDFMREVEIMSAFRHQNILSLIGAVLRDAGNSPWMVFEYMPHGDLAEVLRANSRQLKTPTPGLPPLTTIGGSRLLPVRWMSPESVMYGRFTLESDVWSFGVVLWEVYSFGKQPYYGHNNEEVVKLILQGIMLIPPDDCPPFICNIMCECWKTEPRDRLTFSDILKRLESVKEKERLCQEGSFPRPPQGPITVRSPDVLDLDGYLLPAPTTPCEYLQPLPSLID